MLIKKHITTHLYIVGFLFIYIHLNNLTSILRNFHTNNDKWYKHLLHQRLRIFKNGMMVFWFCYTFWFLFILKNHTLPTLYSCKLTITSTITYTERRFSKLKLSKFNLWFTMSQDRHNSLTLIQKWFFEKTLIMNWLFIIL